MTSKKKISQFCTSLGWKTSYSGKKRTMFVHTSINQDDLEVAIIQQFGVMPDFTLVKAD